MEFLSEYGMFLAKAATIVVALLGVGWSSGCLAPTLQRGSQSRRSSVSSDEFALGPLERLQRHSHAGAWKREVGFIWLLR